MYRETAKEPFDHDYGLPVANGAVEIEEHERLAKARRESILRFALAGGPSGISDQDSVLVVNRDNNSTFHAAFPGVEANAEIGDGLQVHAPLREVGMAQVNASKCKASGLLLSSTTVGANERAPSEAETVCSLEDGVAMTPNQS